MELKSAAAAAAQVDPCWLAAESADEAEVGWMGGGGEVAEDAAAVVGGVDELALKKYHDAGIEQYVLKIIKTRNSIRNIILLS